MQPQNTSAKKCKKSKQKCQKMQIACFSLFFAFFGGGLVWASNFSKMEKNLGKMQKNRLYHIIYTWLTFHLQVMKFSCAPSIDHAQSQRDGHVGSLGEAEARPALWVSSWQQ